MLSIDTVFNEQGRRKGSVMLDIGQDILGEHTRISRYKCLIINKKEANIDMIEAAIKRDCADGVRLKEMHSHRLKEMRRDDVYSVTYSLATKDASPLHSYILYTRTREIITIALITGSFAPSQLDSELEKLKKIFIKVNKN